MHRQINFHQLEHALHQLGFEETWVNGSYVKFSNPQADTLIVLSSYPQNRTVQIAHIRMIEKVLEEKGIIDREDFENLFQ